MKRLNEEIITWKIDTFLKISANSTINKDDE